MLKRAQKAYKSFQYKTARRWAERVLGLGRATQRQKLEASLWAGAAAYLMDDAETARRRFRQAHQTGANPGLSAKWFPKHMIEFFENAGQNSQGPAGEQSGR